MQDITLEYTHLSPVVGGQPEVLKVFTQLTVGVINLQDELEQGAVKIRVNGILEVKVTFVLKTPPIRDRQQQHSF